MTNPLVTVFIPVYNCEDYIAESLESILSQTYQNLEVLLVDDGSTDRSVNIINTYNDSRIRLVQNPENMGIPYTRNVGLKEAKGEYMAIMDSDDISDPERIEKQINYLEKNKDVDAVGSFYLKFGHKSIKKVTTKYITPEAVKIMLLFFDPIANPSATVRLKTIKDKNIQYNPKFFVAQDYELWVQLSKFGKIGIIPEFLLNYRSGHENITKKSVRDKKKKRLQLISEIHEDALNHYNIDLNKEEKAVYDEFFSYNYGSIQNTSIIITMIDKLKEWNHKSSIFDRQLFLDVLDYCSLIGLSNQQISIKEKLQLYNKLISRKSIKSLSYLIVKHLYYRLK